IDRQHRLRLADPDALHDIAQARPGVLGEKALGAGAGGASQQTQDPSGDMWKNPVGNIGVKISQSLLGNARLRPPGCVSLIPAMSVLVLDFDRLGASRLMSS